MNAAYIKLPNMKDTSQEARVEQECNAKERKNLIRRRWNEKIIMQTLSRLALSCCARLNLRYQIERGSKYCTLRHEGKESVKKSNRTKEFTGFKMDCSYITEGKMGVFIDIEHSLL
jgi:hypothetical protein